jgi:hypothetical protein
VNQMLEEPILDESPALDIEDTLKESWLFTTEAGGGISPKLILALVIAALCVGTIILAVSVAVRL